MRRVLAGVVAAAIALSAVPGLAQEKLTVWWVKGFYKSEDEALYAALALQGRGANTVIITMSGAGAVLTRLIRQAIGFRSIPKEGIPRRWLSVKVVPLPQKGSRTAPPWGSCRVVKN